MKVIVCLDKNNGMLFNKRRQSSDRLLRERMLALVKDKRLWMNTYSAKQFTDVSSICVDERFWEKAEQGEYCFVEDTDILPLADKIESIVIYRWQTVYPSDVKFPMTVLKDKPLMFTEEFEGYSHARITEEIYEW